MRYPAVLAVGLCASVVACTPDAPPASPTDTAAEALTAAGGGPGVSIIEPESYQGYDQGLTGAEVDVVVAVVGVEIGAGAHSLVVFLDGAPVTVETTATFTLKGVGKGQHQLAVWLSDPAGVLVDAEAALDSLYVRVTADCDGASDCDDALSCTKQTCSAGACKYGPTVGCCDHDLECPFGFSCADNTCIECAADSGCEDANPCTDDSCVAGACVHSASAGCCQTDAECDDGDFCTVGACDLGTSSCVYEPKPDEGCCNDDSDCVPEEPCATAYCYRNHAKNIQFCRFGPFVSGCCTSDAECEDGNPCSVDVCQVASPGDAAGACAHLEDPAKPGCCLTSGQCDDGSVATQDTCVANVCEYEADPTYCELPTTGALVINELMIAPGTWDDADAEWFEVYNTTDAAIPLDGWSIETSTGESHLLDAAGGGFGKYALTVMPQSFYVFARSKSLAVNGGFSPSHVYGTDISLPDPFEDDAEAAPVKHTLRLRDASGALVDEVTYDTAAWPLEDGRSIELVHAFADNDQPGSWRVAGYSQKGFYNKPFGTDAAPLFGSPRNQNKSSYQGMGGGDCVIPNGVGCVTATCDMTNHCEFEASAGCCTKDDDCDDGDVCTDDICGGNLVCTHEEIAECCAADSECDDGNPCNLDRCIEAVCQFSPDVVEGCCQTDDTCGVGTFCMDHECEAPVLPESMVAQLTTVVHQGPQKAYPSVLSYCTWEACSISPRTYHEPLADGRYIVGYTSQASDGQIVWATADGIYDSLALPGRQVWGLAVRPDESFGVLLRHYDPEWPGGGSLVMVMAQFSADGAPMWELPLNSGIAAPNIELSGGGVLGGSRLAYQPADGRYGAYFTVQGIAGSKTGHHGDQLSFINDDGTFASSGWPWGCSHSMAQLVSSHPDFENFVTVCSSDAFPNTGVLTWKGTTVYQGGGAGNGLVSSQLGQVVPTPTGWLLAFNAVERPCCEGKGVAVRKLDAGGDPDGEVVWITDTTGALERDPALARIGTKDDPEMYLLGWKNAANPYSYWLTIIDRHGNKLMEPQKVWQKKGPFGPNFWGRRDDSFRTAPNGDVTWVTIPGSWANLKIARFEMPAQGDARAPTPD